MARLEVKVTPRARRNKIAGLFQGRMISVKVTAPPVDGRANDQLIDFLAEQLGISPDDIEIIRGHTTRHKVLEINGLSEDEIMRRLGLSK